MKDNTMIDQTEFQHEDPQTNSKKTKKKHENSGINTKLKKIMVSPLRKGRLTDGAAIISIWKFIRDITQNGNDEQVIHIKPAPELEEEIELLVTTKDDEIELEDVASDDEVLIADAIPSMPSVDKEIAMEELPIATSVDDSMSFKAAFTAAREELGGGGLFVWRGKPYGTYLGSEWKALSADAKEHYTDNVRYTIDLLEQEQAEEMEAEIVERPELETVAELEPKPANRIDSEVSLSPSHINEEADDEAIFDEQEDEIVDEVDEKTDEEINEETEIFVEAEDDMVEHDYFSDDMHHTETSHPDYDVQPGYTIDPELSFNNDMDMGEFIFDTNPEMEP